MAAIPGGKLGTQIGRKGTRQAWPRFVERTGLLCLANDEGVFAIRVDDTPRARHDRRGEVHKMQAVVRSKSKIRDEEVRRRVEQPGARGLKIGTAVDIGDPRQSPPEQTDSLSIKIDDKRLPEHRIGQRHTDGARQG